MSKAKKYSGKIKWFDQYTKEGVIRLDSGRSVPFYGCNAIGSKSAFSELSCVEYERDTKVTFELHDALGAVKVSGATINEQEWIDQKGKDSTFQLDADGNIKNGLF